MPSSKLFQTSPSLYSWDIFSKRGLSDSYKANLFNVSFLKDYMKKVNDEFEPLSL